MLNCKECTKKLNKILIFKEIIQKQPAYTVNYFLFRSNLNPKFEYGESNV